MRSRYAAYALDLAPYLLATWHPSTRPATWAAEAGTQWLGLHVKRDQLLDENHASVEFVARYRVAGRGYRLHEISRFVREDDLWYYVDGEFPGAAETPAGSVLAD